MRLTSNSPEETGEIGRRIGRSLRPGDVVALYGDLGAGKTTLVKGIASAFGIDPRDVTSASFTIIAGYESSPPFFHVDLYRIERAEEADGIGLWECLGGGGIAVIEWADRLGEDAARDFIKVYITALGGDRREFRIEGIKE